MEIAYNPAKDRANRRNHGLSLEAARLLFREGGAPLLEDIDDRFDYGEERWTTFGLIGGNVHVCVWTPRRDIRWVISLRPATKREADDYFKEIDRR